MHQIQQLAFIQSRIIGPIQYHPCHRRVRGCKQVVEHFCLHPCTERPHAVKMRAHCVKQGLNRVQFRVFAPQHKAEARFLCCNLRTGHGRVDQSDMVRHPISQRANIARRQGGGDDNPFKQGCRT